MEEAAVVGEREESVSWWCHFGRLWARTKETCKVMTEEEPLSGDRVGGGDSSNCINTKKLGPFLKPPNRGHVNYLSQKCPVKMPNYQQSGSRVHRSLWTRLLLPLLLQPPLSLAILVPGQDPRHAHPGTR